MRYAASSKHATKTRLLDKQSGKPDARNFPRFLRQLNIGSPYPESGPNQELVDFVD
jgi:hypothetical protein